MESKIGELYKRLDQDFEEDASYLKESDHLDNQILGFLKTVPHGTILEVGCARGNLTRKLTKESNRVTAIDVSKHALNIAKTKAPLATFQNTNFESFKPNQKFDVIICSEVLYYMKKRNETLNKLKKYGDYLISNNFILGSGAIGFGSLIYEVLLRRFKLLKIKVRFSLLPLDLGVLSLWKLN